VPSKEQPQAGSHAVVLAPGAVGLAVRESAGSIELATSGIVVTVEKSPFRIAYSYKGRPLVAEKQGYGHAGNWSRSNSRSTAARRCTAPARARSA
jgi:oligosaccharide 4-alpha-D-glucosyltransferase